MNKSANRSFSFPVFRPASAAKRIRFLGFLAGLILMLAWAAELLRAESWTDAAGKFTFEADFVGVHAGEVHLKRKADGVTIKVPFQELSAESQQLAKSLQGAPTRPPTAPTSQPSATAGTGHPPAKPVIDPAALLMPIADFLDASTVAVGHVDLTKINLDAALELFHACAPAAPGDDAGVAVVLEGVGELQRQLIQAGVPDVYVVARMDLASARSPASILLAAPVSAGKDPQAVLEMLSAVSPVPWTVKGNRVLLAFAGEREAWQRIQPRPRQDFLAPLQAAEDTALQLAVIPNADVRRIPLAVAASAGPNTAQESVTGLVTAQQKGQWAVLTATAPPQPAVALILQMEDATAAGTIQGCVTKSLDLVRRDRQLRRDISQLDELAKLLTPTFRDRQLRIVLTGDNGGVKTMLTAVAQAASPTARANQDELARNQLIEIGLGLQNFHDTYLKFPAQASPSRDGKPLLSWRVAILPFLGAGELYKQFRLDEPWDSEHNQQLIARMPAVFASPDLPAELRAKGMTTYAAPVGPGTVFGGTEGTKFYSITDGTSTTVAVVEAAPAKAVVWTKPDDLAIDPKDARTGLTGQAGGGFNVLMVDGAVHRLPDSIDPQELGWLFQRNDGRSVAPPIDELDLNIEGAAKEMLDVLWGWANWRCAELRRDAKKLARQTAAHNKAAGVKTEPPKYRTADEAAKAFVTATTEKDWRACYRCLAPEAQDLAVAHLITMCRFAARGEREEKLNELLKRHAFDPAKASAGANVVKTAAEKEKKIPNWRLVVTAYVQSVKDKEAFAEAILDWAEENYGSESGQEVLSVKIEELATDGDSAIGYLVAGSGPGWGIRFRRIDGAWLVTFADEAFEPAAWNDLFLFDYLDTIHGWRF